MQAANESSEAEQLHGTKCELEEAHSKARMKCDAVRAALADIEVPTIGQSLGLAVARGPGAGVCGLGTGPNLAMGLGRGLGAGRLGGWGCGAGCSQESQGSRANG